MTLDPRERKSWQGFLDLLQPPAGYRLSAALGTLLWPVDRRAHGGPADYERHRRGSARRRAGCGSDDYHPPAQQGSSTRASGHDLR